MHLKNQTNLTRAHTPCRSVELAALALVAGVAPVLRGQQHLERLCALGDVKLLSSGGPRYNTDLLAVAVAVAVAMAVVAAEASPLPWSMASPPLQAWPSPCRCRPTPYALMPITFPRRQGTLYRGAHRHRCVRSTDRDAVRTQTATATAYASAEGTLAALAQLFDAGL